MAGQCVDHLHGVHERWHAVRDDIRRLGVKRFDHLLEVAQKPHVVLRLVERVGDGHVNFSPSLEQLFRLLVRVLVGLIALLVLQGEHTAQRGGKW